MMPKLTRRSAILLAIALAAVVLLTLLAAPKGNLRQSGSTYGRSPDGYGAWYAVMQQQELPIQRWQKPVPPTFPGAAPQRMTLIRISNQIEPLDSHGFEAWVAQGNVLILLGASAPVSKAPFSTTVPSSAGDVRIDTARRLKPEGEVLLGDGFGAIVRQVKQGKGRMILVSTPYLAANAYQEARGNFQVLTTLATQAGNPIWVDEYLHGYKDPVQVEQETGNNLLGYLAKTPLLLLVIQGGVILVVLVWGQNQRFGRPLQLSQPTVDNSAAYIEAMAAVLHKAECSEFVLERVGKAEQLAIQQALGLGNTLLSPESLTTAWGQQTGRSPLELQTVLAIAQRHRRISEAELRQWLAVIQQFRQPLHSRLSPMGDLALSRDGQETQGSANG